MSGIRDLPCRMDGNCKRSIIKPNAEILRIADWPQYRARLPCHDNALADARINSVRPFDVIVLDALLFHLYPLIQTHHAANASAATRYATTTRVLRCRIIGRP